MREPLATGRPSRDCKQAPQIAYRTSRTRPAAAAAAPEAAPPEPVARASLSRGNKKQRRKASNPAAVPRSYQDLGHDAAPGDDVGVASGPSRAPCPPRTAVVADHWAPEHHAFDLRLQKQQHSIAGPGLYSGAMEEAAQKRLQLGLGLATHATLVSRGIAMTKRTKSAERLPSCPVARRVGSGMCRVGVGVWVQGQVYPGFVHR